MRTTFARFDIGPFLKVHRYTIVYYTILNCGLLTKLWIFPNFWRTFFKGSVVCHNMIFNLYLWTGYTGASLILEKLVSRSNFYDIACFSIHASGPHLDASVTSDNFFRNSSIDAIIFSCRPLIMDASLVLEDFSDRSEISPKIKGLNSC